LTPSAPTSRRTASPSSKEGARRERTERAPNTSVNVALQYTKTTPWRHRRRRHLACLRRGAAGRGRSQLAPRLVVAASFTGGTNPIVWHVARSTAAPHRHHRPPQPGPQPRRRRAHLAGRCGEQWSKDKPRACRVEAGTGRVRETAAAALSRLLGVVGDGGEAAPLRGGQRAPDAPRSRARVRCR